MNTIQLREKLYGVYWSIDGDRQAGCVVGDNQSDKDIVGNLIASDFLSQWSEHIVIHKEDSIYIHCNYHGQVGGLELVLKYEEEFV